MKNYEYPVIEIIRRIKSLAFELAPQVSGENAEFQILDCVTDEILLHIGEVKNNNKVKKALIYMFEAGRRFPYKEPEQQ